MCVGAVHLSSGREAASVRLRQLCALVEAGKSRKALVVMGDFNVYGEDELELCGGAGLTDAGYSGYSWNPRVNRFFANQDSEFAEGGQRFDRIMFSGWA